MKKTKKQILDQFDMSQIDANDEEAIFMAMEEYARQERPIWAKRWALITIVVAIISVTASMLKYFHK